MKINIHKNNNKNKFLVPAIAVVVALAVIASTVIDDELCSCSIVRSKRPTTQGDVWLEMMRIINECQYNNITTLKKFGYGCYKCEEKGLFT